MPTPLETLKKGFRKLTSQIQKRRKDLQDKLARRESISSSDETWLDTEGNVVDEQRILETLESASDYERAYTQLDNNGLEIVRHLEQLGGDLAPEQTVAGKKRPSSSDTPVTMTHTKGKKDSKKGLRTGSENATIAQRIEILDWHHKNGKNQTKTATHFLSIYPKLGLTQPLVSKWLKKEDKWREQWESASRKSEREAKRIRSTKYPEIDEMLRLWVAMAMEDGILLDGDVLREKWRSFADMRQVPADEQLKLSHGWLDSFKNRTGLCHRKRHGEAGSVKQEAVDAERQRMQALLKESGYKLNEIYNMDETGLFYSLPPDRGLSDRKLPGVKGKKVRLTYALTCNADGSHKLEPFVIGNAERPRAFNKKSGATLGFLYRSNAKAWMTSSLYRDWIVAWDRELQQQKKRVLLLQDNFSGHIVPPNLKCIRVENFQPNLTAHVQPMDQGIIRCFKAHYRSRFVHRAIDRYEEGITPSQIYDINQLEAMRLADEAWREVDTTTIRNCWRKAGIIPESMPDDAPISPPSVPISTLIHHSSTQLNPVAQAEAQVSTALDSLVATGALQRVNRMDIDNLLNPEGESEMLTETSDKEIFDAVIEATEARENIEINGGDDVNDSSPYTDPLPTRREVLRAVSTVRRHVNSVNDPFAREMESLLGSFNRQMRLQINEGLRDTTLDQYFKH